jgi:hypothetical protein
VDRRHQGIPSLLVAQGYILVSQHKKEMKTKVCGLSLFFSSCVRTLTFVFFFFIGSRI